MFPPLKCQRCYLHYILFFFLQGVVCIWFALEPAAITTGVGFARQPGPVTAWEAIGSAKKTQNRTCTVHFC